MQGDTRAAIIRAAMEGFARKGFEATTTREIAAAAGCNLAAISYYFGGKDGLRLACAETIVATLSAVANRRVEGRPEPTDPEAAQAALLGLTRRMVHFVLLRPEAAAIAGFVMREVAQPSAALDAIYEGMIERVHRRVCLLWGAATGQPAESDAVRLAVFSTVGQIFYFHVARPVVMRRLGWSAIGRREARAIGATVSANLRARLAADRGDTA